VKSVIYAKIRFLGTSRFRSTAKATKFSRSIQTNSTPVPSCLRVRTERQPQLCRRCWAMPPRGKRRYLARNRYPVRVCAPHLNQPTQPLRQRSCAVPWPPPRDCSGSQRRGSLRELFRHGLIARPLKMMVGSWSCGSISATAARDLCRISPAQLRYLVLGCQQCRLRHRLAAGGRGARNQSSCPARPNHNLQALRHQSVRAHHGGGHSKKNVGASVPLVYGLHKLTDG